VFGLFPKGEEWLPGLADWASEVHTAAATMKNKVRFMAVFKSIVLHGNTVPEEESALVAVLSPNGWTRWSVPLHPQIPLHSKLKVGKIV
jgi:hypothetical protein